MANNHAHREQDVSIATIEWFAKYADFVGNLAMRRFVYLLLSLLVFVGCSRAVDYQVIRLTLETTKPPLTCRVVVPHQLPASAPVVIAYHGIGDTPESMATYTKLDYLAARHGFLLVYPDAEGKLWKVPRRDAPSRDTNRDIERFDLLLKDIKQQYDIDPQRVYVVGMSQGATFVHWLIRQRSAQIAAAAAHSGAPPGGVDLPQTNVPILLIAGQEDPVHGAIRSAADQYQATGTQSRFISVPGLGHNWSATHNEAIWTFLNQEHLGPTARPK